MGRLGARGWGSLESESTLFCIISFPSYFLLCCFFDEIRYIYIQVAILFQCGIYFNRREHIFILKKALKSEETKSYAIIDRIVYLLWYYVNEQRTYYVFRRRNRNNASGQRYIIFIQFFPWPFLSSFPLLSFFFILSLKFYNRGTARKKVLEIL